MSSAYSISIGIYVSSETDLLQSLSSAVAAGYSFISTPLFHSQRLDSNTSSFRRSRTDFHIPHSKWARSVVGVCSEINMDSTIESDAILEEELEWAAHLGLSAILLPKISSYLGPSLSTLSSQSQSSVSSSSSLSSSLSKTATSTLTTTRFHLGRLAASICAQYSTRIAGALQRLGDDAPTVWLPLLFSWDEQHDGNETRDDKSSEQHDTLTLNTWDVWNAARTLLDQHPLVQLALELPSCLSPLSYKQCLERWLGEPVRCVIVPTRIFVLNRSGFPVLSRLHQRCVIELHRAQVHVLVVESKDMTDFDKKRHPLDVYCTYLKHLLSTSRDKFKDVNEENPSSTDMFLIDDPDNVQETNTRLEQDRKAFEAPWHDFLQVPLQPLASNLSSSVYEVFEKDPVKYITYERAVFSSLSSLISKLKYSQDGMNTILPECILIAVVGAGRGPLVSSILRAADDLKLPKNKLHVFAIEKNRNAVFTLRSVLSSHEQQHCSSAETTTTASGEVYESRGNWAGRVTVIQADIRNLVSYSVIQRPEPFNQLPVKPLHMIVSELLGSFGDNELSPECLDAAQQLLIPEIGVMIPFRSTSFLTPISSQRLWSEVRKTQAIAGAAGSGVSGGLFAGSKWFETPLVVSMANVHTLAEHPLPVFSFTHPSVGKEDESLTSIAANNDHNVREVTLRFPPLSSTSLLHGFAGYFTADLIDGVTLSILPDPSLRTQGLFSWFPIFFPLRDPILCSKGDEIEIKMWRKSSSSGGGGSLGTGTVWYEWAVTSPSISHIHNAGGRSSVINF
jgi:protein arginine N-methyltransferase 5